LALELILFAVFVEDVILGGLKAGPSWFVSDNLLRRDAKSGIPDDVVREIADRNDLRYERVVAGGVEGSGGLSKCA
jgi:hypothetical protein